MNKIEFIKDKIPFTQVANGVLNDKRISAKAKGLYAYLYSKPDGWDFAVSRIMLDMSDGRDSIQEGLRELERFGFLTRQRQPSGRVTYMVHFPPIYPNTENPVMAEEPNTEKPTNGKSHSGKTRTVSNKDSIVIKSISNKDISEAIAPQYISDGIKLFEGVNKACSKFYVNKTQREAMKNLIDAYGADKVSSVISLLPKLNAVIFNKATTPLELWNKWAKIEAEAIQLKLKKSNNRYTVGEIQNYE